MPQLIKSLCIEPERPLAVVVGVCAHGLGMIRSLARAGIKVIAVERDATLPGNLTCYATIHRVKDINGPGLIDALKALAETIAARCKPVLILTNDTMSRTVGENVGSIAPYYHLSWADVAPVVLALLNKENIEQRCYQVGLNYPKSVLLTCLENISSEASALTFPIILKPVQPLSAFKTLLVHCTEALRGSLPLIAKCLPVLAQEFIPGDDRMIRFAALYLQSGKVLARFEGRKLYSRPMGLTTIAVSEPNDEIHKLALRFFDGLGLSGPVSLELKQAPDGTHWVMEPTVGRTDFWEGVCSSNGINLPLIEYCSQAGMPIPAMKQRTTHVWVNGERHPSVGFWLLAHAPKLLFSQRFRGAYFDCQDTGPYWYALWNYWCDLPRRVARKAKKLLVRGIVSV